MLYLPRVEIVVDVTQTLNVITEAPDLENLQMTGIIKNYIAMEKRKVKNKLIIGVPLFIQTGLSSSAHGISHRLSLDKLKARQFPCPESLPRTSEKSVKHE